MAQYTFYFRFPHMDPDRQNKKIESWGGHLGSALNRAWKQLRNDKMYKGIKDLRPICIDIEPKNATSKGR